MEGQATVQQLQINCSDIPIQGVFFGSVSFFPPFAYALFFTAEEKSSSPPRYILLFSLDRAFPAVFLCSENTLFVLSALIHSHKRTFSSPLFQTLTEVCAKKPRVLSIRSFPSPKDEWTGTGLEINFSSGESLELFFDAFPRGYLTQKDGNIISCGSTIPYGSAPEMKNPTFPSLFLSEIDFIQALQQKKYRDYHIKAVHGCRKALQKQEAYLKKLSSIEESLISKEENIKKRLTLLTMLWGKTTLGREHYTVEDPSTQESHTISLPQGRSLQEEIAKTAHAIKKLERTKQAIPLERTRCEQQRKSLLREMARLQAISEEDIARAYQSTAGGIAKKSSPVSVSERRSVKKTKGKFNQSKLMRFLAKDGAVILLGMNADANHTLTFHTARSQDMWFHVDSQHGSGPHVIVQTHGREVSFETIQLAAHIAAWFHLSQKKRHKLTYDATPLIDVIYTSRKNLFRRKGMKKGEAAYTSDIKRIRVAPMKNRVDEARLRYETKREEPLS